MKRRNTEPPGIPPAPTDAKTIETHRVAIWRTSRWCPNMLAASMTKTGRCTHTPSMLTVAPIGSENEESLRSTPSASADLNETGSVAALERVTKAVMIGSRMRMSTRYGFTRQKSASASG